MRKGIKLLALPLLAVGLASCDIISLGDKLFGGGTNTEYDYLVDFEAGDKTYEEDFDWLHVHWVSGKVNIHLAEDNDSDEETPEAFIIKETANKKLSSELTVHTGHKVIDGHNRLYVEYCKSGKYDWTGISKDIDITVPASLLVYLSISVDTANVTVDGVRCNKFVLSANHLEADINVSDCTEEFSIATLDNTKDYNDKIKINLNSDCKLLSLSGQGFNVNAKKIEEGHITGSSKITLVADEIKNFKITNDAYDMDITVNKFREFEIDTDGNTNINIPENIYAFTLTVSKGADKLNSDFELTQSGNTFIYNKDHYNTMKIASKGETNILKFIPNSED